MVVESYDRRGIRCPHCEVVVVMEEIAPPALPPAIPRRGVQPVQQEVLREAPAGKVSGYVCTLCGWQGRPKTRAKGSILIEIVLWLFFLVPGLIYSIWRLTTKDRVCRSCGSVAIIPAGSPRGRAMLGMRA